MRNILKVLVKLIISLGALYFVLRQIELPQIINLYKRSDPVYLLLAIALFALSKIISAYRLNRLFSMTGIDLSQKKNLQLYWLGMYYNIFLPGGVGGDGYKTYLLNRQFKKPVKTILTAILVDRANGMFVLLILSCLFFSVTIEPKWLSITLAGMIPLGYLIYFLIMKRFFPVFKGFIHTINVYSLLVQVSQIVMIIMILHSWGIEDHLIIYTAIFLVSSVVAILPITIGGAGARELTFLFFSAYMTFDLNAAVALSLMFYLITLLVSLGGMIFSLKKVRFE
ncbi:MAG: lysylphosphatidylglycerol synthase transmembrane domain-containing protein [Bacteroidales bacterium]|nr:flippase-like domain-containing protein [Bacteroidales bacterium]MBS3775840.1 flippase-like domain-containing protein [Bacteroidales bacterium]